MHFVPIPDAPLATLEHAVQVLAVRRGYDNLNAAVEQYTAVLGEPSLALVSGLRAPSACSPALGRRCPETVEISYRAPRQVRHRAQSQRAASLRPGRPAHRRSLVLPARRRPTAFLTRSVQPRERPRHQESCAVLRCPPCDHRAGWAAPPSRRCSGRRVLRPGTARVAQLPPDLCGGDGDRVDPAGGRRLDALRSQRTPRSSARRCRARSAWPDEATCRRAVFGWVTATTPLKRRVALRCSVLVGPSGRGGGR